MKKRSVMIAVAITVVGLAIFAAALIAADFDFSRLSMTEYKTNSYSVSGKFKDIDIDCSGSDVILLDSESGSAIVNCVEQNKVSYSVTVEDNTLKIAVNDNREWYDYLSLFKKPATIAVYLPEVSLRSLCIRNNTGDVTIPSEFSFNDAVIESSAGDIIFNSAVKENLNLTTNTGDISLAENRAKKIDLSVSTGNIRLNSVVCKDDLSLRFTTGSTQINDLLCKKLTVNGSAGDINMKDAVAAETFDIETSTGDINFENCDAESISFKTSTGDVTGTLQSAKVFTAKSSTGSVDVPDTASGGRCDISTSTGDISIKITD